MKRCILAHSLSSFRRPDRYVLEDFDAKSTFSSFLPGVAGYFGKPVWVFYVNRGQAVSTFGTESKDYPILEFNPANKVKLLQLDALAIVFVFVYAVCC
jgi:hypothetical protein